MKPSISALAGALLLLPSISQADALPINAGLWEMTTTMNNPFTGSKTETKQECVKEDKFDPESFMQDAQGCQLDNSDLNGDTLTFSMSCNMQGMQANVQGEFQTDGSTAQGNMQMNVNMGGQAMTIENEWSGTRIGDC